jgi:hypothetical protein
MARPLLHNETPEENTDFDFADPSQADNSEEEAASDIPEKFAGKSQAELATMLMEAERFRGKQANEVGDLRRSVDELLKAQLVKEQAAPVVEEEEIDFFTDPDKAIARKIETHPDIVAAREATTRNTQAATKAQLLQAHPDMEAIVADAKFGEWVEASPVRKRLLAAAHYDYDYDSANELFSNWKERSEIADRTVAVSKQERSQAIKSAGTGSGNPAQSKVSKKMYRRTDIVRLMNSDPERYAAMSEEIFKAYAENRVI